MFDDNATSSITSDDFSPDPVLNGSNNTGDTNFNFILDPGEAWLYTASETVRHGQQTNIATASGLPLDENNNPVGLPEVFDTDPANYFGV